MTLIDCCCRKLPAVHHSTSRPLARGAITSTSINADNTRQLQAEDRAARVHRLSNVITCSAGLHTKRGVWRESRTCTDSVSRRVNINSRVPARQSPAVFPHHHRRLSGGFPAIKLYYSYISFILIWMTDMGSLLPCLVITYGWRCRIRSTIGTIPLPSSFLPAPPVHSRRPSA